MTPSASTYWKMSALAVTGSVTRARIPSAMVSVRGFARKWRAKPSFVSGAARAAPPDERAPLRVAHLTPHFLGEASVPLIDPHGIRGRLGRQRLSHIITHRG